MSLAKTDILVFLYRGYLADKNRYFTVREIEKGVKNGEVIKQLKTLFWEGFIVSDGGTHGWGKGYRLNQERANTIKKLIHILEEPAPSFVLGGMKT